MPDAGEGALLLLRAFRRKTSLESPAEDFYEAEFRLPDGSPDLRPSVYEIRAKDIVRTIAEHQAGAALDPKANLRGHPDVRPAYEGPITESPCDSDWFEFVNKAHRELEFEGKAELLEFAGRLKHCCFHPVSTSQLREYLRSVKDSPEWQAFFEKSKRPKRWLRLTR